jgi:hypothetical protein
MNDHITKPISFDELTMSLIQWMPAVPVQPSPVAAPRPLTLPAEDSIPDWLPPSIFRQPYYAITASRNLSASCS